MMSHPSFIYTLLLITSFLVRLACAQGVEALPVIQGECNGLKIAAQGAGIELRSQPLSPKHDLEDSASGLNRAMQAKGFARLVLKPDEIELFQVPGSQQPNIIIAIPDIDPTPTFSVLPTGIADIDQTPGVLFLNNTTLGELAQLVTTIDIEPVPTIERYYSTADIDDDTLTVIDPVPTQERRDLTKLSEDPIRESLESSAFISPTPVPTVRVEGEGQEARVQLEFGLNITVIQPSPTKGYSGSGSKNYTVSYQPRQMGTTSEQGSASHSSSTATGESSKTQPSPTSTASTTSEVAGSSTDSPPPAKRKKLAAVPDSTTEEVEASEPIQPREETYDERKARIIAEYMAEKKEERLRLDECHQKWLQQEIEKDDRDIALQTDPKKIERLIRIKEEFIKKDAERVRARKEDWAADD